jgi:hypothetical protein
MVTFELHFLGTDGRTTGRILDPLEGGADAVPFESRHGSTARRAAREAAARAECDVLVARIVDGEVRPAYVVRPDGRQANPPGSVAVQREACTAGNGRPCFCTACRAERKAAKS